jgi:hypothetical protein
MTNEEKIKAITKFQNLGYVHPLTCGVGTGGHADLVGKEKDGKVILVCLDCDYEQEWVPEYVYSMKDMPDLFKF